MPEESLPQAIANELRRDILRGVLEPGAAVKEREQASLRNVSRTPMREAIRILAKEGLVELRHSRSPVVADPSFDEIHDQIEVLRALESLAGELACERASDAEIARIRTICEEHIAACDGADLVELFEIDMRFHVAITEASHSAALTTTYRTYLERLWRARYLASIRASARARVKRQHTAMVEALERRDPARLRREIGAHLRALEVNIRLLFDEGSQGGAKKRSSWPDLKSDARKSGLRAKAVKSSA